MYVCVFSRVCTLLCVCMRMVCNLAWRLVVEQHAKTEHVSALDLCIHAGLAVARSLPRNHMCVVWSWTQERNLEKSHPHKYPILTISVNTERTLGEVSLQYLPPTRSRGIFELCVRTRGMERRGKKTR